MLSGRETPLIHLRATGWHCSVAKHALADVSLHDNLDRVGFANVCMIRTLEAGNALTMMTNRALGGMC